MLEIIQHRGPFADHGSVFSAARSVGLAAYCGSDAIGERVQKRDIVPGELSLVSAAHFEDSEGELGVTMDRHADHPMHAMVGQCRQCLDTSVRQKLAEADGLSCVPSEPCRGFQPGFEPCPANHVVLPAHPVCRTKS